MDVVVLAQASMARVTNLLDEQTRNKVRREEKREGSEKEKREQGGRRGEGRGESQQNQIQKNIHRNECRCQFCQVRVWVLSDSKKRFWQ